ncbi:bacterial transcriptional activator domain-containing protein [Actinomadura sp. NPDC048394]|uniref:bacterial transcriptional activator domain-containing protein n=1 Tax=Actinomadura sp. NPDC048394 TaxID=3158223 RepID=UPI0033FC779A
MAGVVDPQSPADRHRTHRAHVHHPDRRPLPARPEPHRRRPWRLSASLQGARQTEDDAEHARAIDTVVDLYTADFADGLTHEWAANHREHLRRATINALARLAQRLEEHPDKAIPALEHAIRLDPCAEPHYRSLMKLEARLGNRDAVKRTCQLLSRHLDDLDADPEPETQQLLPNLPRSRPR